MDGIESILTSVKKFLGIDESYTQFDMDLVLHINSVFSVLTQLGVGPEDGFKIQDAGATWTNFLEDSSTLEMVKSYMYLKVRLLFDPPSNSFLVDSMQNEINEFEWRMQVGAELAKISEKGD